MRTRGEGVKKSENFADVINGRPLKGSVAIIGLIIKKKPAEGASQRDVPEI